MHYVILRDDDTNALTPPEWLDELYRPFLDRRLPVNLATIPKVRTDVVGPNGQTEGFLVSRRESKAGPLPIAKNQRLVSYLLANPKYRILQHGYDHSLFEFDSSLPSDVSRRLEEGTRLLIEAGFPKPTVFVAPYDRLSRVSWREAAKRFAVLSTGWFEARRLPISWWPGYFRKKWLKRAHWEVSGTLLLSHPGCLLSYHRPIETMLDQVKKTVRSQRVTVLVTHWWEYFRSGAPDKAFIRILHETAAWLADEPGVEVIAFEDLARGGIALH